MGMVGTMISMPLPPPSSSLPAHVLALKATNVCTRGFSTISSATGGSGSEGLCRACCVRGEGGVVVVASNRK